MCEPVSATIAAISAAVAVGGSMMSMKAQQNAANAVADQNRATMTAQNEAFTQRMRAANAQTAAQSDVMNRTMTDRNAAFTQMREGQTAAMQRQQSIVDAENAQAEVLRAQGDTAGRQMLATTTGPDLAGAQTGAQQQAATLLASNVQPILGPSGTDPNANAGDRTTKQAIARRLAESATNVRDYGSKVANVQSYAAPGQTISDAIAANKFGIMPAQTAEHLLVTGSPVRLAPTQIAYQNATQTGAATDALISSRGQSGLDAASLSYGNVTDIANLTQSDLTTLAANRQKQQAADAAAQAGLGSMISGIGQLGLYGAGRYGSAPSWLTNIPKTT